MDGEKGPDESGFKAEFGYDDRKGVGACDLDPPGLGRRGWCTSGDGSCLHTTGGLVALFAFITQMHLLNSPVNMQVQGSCLAGERSLAVPFRRSVSWISNLLSLFTIMEIKNKLKKCQLI